LIQRDYSNGGFYDYYTHGAGVGREPKEPVKPVGPEAKTDTGRAVYSGGGISPDEAIGPRTVNLTQRRILSPAFAFARELVNGRVRGFEASRIADDVLVHSVEIGVLSFRPEDPNLKSVVVYRDELAFVVNPKHPLASEKEVSIRQLGAQNFVAHNIASPQRQKVIETFRRHKTPLRIGVEMPSLEAVKRFVERGNGVALVPGLTLERELASGSLVRVRVKELQLERRLRLVYRRQANLSHAALAFLKVVEEYAQTHGDPFSYHPERGNGAG